MYVHDVELPNDRNLRKLDPSFDPEHPEGWRHEPPQNIQHLAPPGFKWAKNYNVSGEFNPAEKGRGLSLLQRKRWTQQNRWRGRYPAIFTDDNVLFQNNGVTLRVRGGPATEEFVAVHQRHQVHSLNPREKETVSQRQGKWKKFFYTSFVKSTKPITYGYTELACKLGDSALSSAFWLKEHEKTKREVDVFEYSTAAKTFRGVPFSNFFLTNLHVFENPRSGNSTYKKAKSINMRTDLSKEKVVKVGLLWTKEKLIWLLNDDIVREVIHNGIFQDTKMHVQFDREYLSWFGEPHHTDDRMGDFHVYYCRTWQL